MATETVSATTTATATVTNTVTATVAGTNTVTGNYSAINMGGTTGTRTVTAAVITDIDTVAATATIAPTATVTATASATVTVTAGVSLQSPNSAYCRYSTMISVGPTGNRYNSTSTGTTPNSAGVRFTAGIVGWHIPAL